MYTKLDKKVLAAFPELSRKDLSPKKQIDAHIKYIRHRYKDACDALHHLETRGWH